MYLIDSRVYHNLIYYINVWKNVHRDVHMANMESGVKGIFRELTALNVAAHLHARDEVDAKGERAHT